MLVDASALYPLVKLSRDPRALARRLLEGAAVLDLTLYEVLNAVVVEGRRGLLRDPRSATKMLLSLIEHLEVVRVEPEDLQAIAEVAVELGLTAYDAAYVYYARARGTRLVTSDRELLEKAGDVAVSAEEWLRETLHRSNQGRSI